MQWPKEKGSTKHTHKTKDRVTRSQLRARNYLFSAEAELSLLVAKNTDPTSNQKYCQTERHLYEIVSVKKQNRYYSQQTITYFLLVTVKI